MPNRQATYKNMEKFLKTRNSQRKKYYRKTAFKFKKRRWLAEDDDLVLLHEMTDTELSGKIHRSVSAIQTRRKILKKMKKKENN